MPNVCPHCGLSEVYVFSDSDSIESIKLLDSVHMLEGRARSDFKRTNVWVLDAYLDLWYFIDDPTLRRNIAYNHHYISYLCSLLLNYKIVGDLEKSFFKTIIITAIEIIEAVLRSLLLGKCEFKFNKNGKSMHKTGDRVRSETNFFKLIASGQGSNLLDENIAKKLKLFKALRDKVHIYLMDNYEFIIFNENRAPDVLKAFDFFNIHLAKQYAKRIEA